MARAAATRRPSTRRYSEIRKIDGRHPLKRAAPDCFVGYRARRRHDAQVAFFNFGLAREMGLIPASHPDELNDALCAALLDTFSLVIVNEYDFLHGTRIPEADWLPHSYMATRYLQLQHPDKQGISSGDGRSVWNGCATHRGITWDVSSCGTGVTRLCPATAEHQQFFKTGNYVSSYGCGTAALAEGINAALMSEVLHRNGIPTERVLAVLERPSGLAINVRASTNLLRPSHFFVHLRQARLEPLRGVVDFFIERQIANGCWPMLPAPSSRARSERRYGHLAEEAARTFARITATFEREYIFCWLDWDGDNILADGSIIDYGSVRQFGLFHREYRFEDTDRMSTTIPEQRRKARHIVQKYAQIRDYLVTGKKRPLRDFADDSVLALFDSEFERVKRQLLLEKIGVERRLAERMLKGRLEGLREFERAFSSFERARSSRGPTTVPDGLSWDAIYCVRDLLRELPLRLQEGGARDAGRASILSAREFADIGLSDYASPTDRRLTAHRRRMAREFQRAYVHLVDQAAQRARVGFATMLDRITKRSAVINHDRRITGDSVDHVSTRLIQRRRQLSPEALYRLVGRFADDQDLDPERARRRAEQPDSAPSALEERVLRSLIALTRDFRESL